MGDVGDGHRSLLSSYYDFESDAEDEVEEQEVKRVRPEDRLDLDSPHFQTEEYVSKLLQKHGIKELKEHDHQMIAAKRTLDSDMQMLVYENYNKFIGATDMIRQMKTNVEGMKGEMVQLEATMGQISQSCQTLETSLAPNRGAVDNLVGVSRLLKRLEFLFELPHRLKKSIQLGAHAQAVQFYNVASRILQRYAHIKSFEKIRIESEHIIHLLKVTLRQKIKDQATTAPEQMEAAGLLIQLDSAPEHLLDDIFSGKRAKLLADLQRATERAKAFKLRDAQGEDEDEEDEEGDEGEEEESIVQSVIRIKRGLSGEVEGHDLISQLQVQFVQGFLLFAESFLDTFVRPSSDRKAGKNKEAQEKAAATCKQGLAEFAQEMFAEYFILMRQTLLEQASLGGTANTTDDVEDRVRGLTQSLGKFHRAVVAPARLVPSAHLLSRSTDIIEHCVRHCVENIHDRTQAQCAAVVAAFHTEITEAMLLAVEDPEVLLPASKECASAIRQAAEDSLRLFVPLLSREAYAADTAHSLALAFSDLAHSHLHQLLGYAAGLLAFGARSEAGQEDEDLAPPLPFPVAQALLVQTDRQYPVFYLQLANCCQRMSALELPRLLKFLATCFPAQDTAAHFKVEWAGLAERFADATGVLRQRFVDAAGTSLGDVIAQKLPWRVTDYHQWLRSVITMLHSITAQLRLVYPALEARSKQLGAEKRLSAATGEQGLRRDISRLFTERVAVVAGVKDTPGAVIAALLRQVAKALLETIRERSLSGAVHAALLVELEVLRVEMGLFLPTDATPQQRKEITMLLDECRHSSGDRSVEEVTEVALPADVTRLQAEVTALVPKPVVVRAKPASSSDVSSRRSSTTRTRTATSLKGGRHKLSANSTLASVSSSAITTATTPATEKQANPFDDDDDAILLAPKGASNPFASARPAKSTPDKSNPFA